MPRWNRLDEEQLDAALEGLEGWRVDDGWLQRTYTFGGFLAAVEFMQRCAPGIEAMDHHPNWSNVYATLEVRLQTHDAGALTDLDLGLARLLESEWSRT